MTIDFTEEQLELVNKARSFSKSNIRPKVDEYVDSGEYPWEIFEAAAQEDLIGRWIDIKYGGCSETTVEHCIIAEEFCRGDSNIGPALLSSTIGCPVVAEYGSDKQKKQWIKPVLNGEILSSLGMTEPETGSAVTEVTTTAVKDGDEYIIDGEKRWQGNGSISAWIATLCRTDPDIKKGKEGLSLIIVPREAEGLSASPINKLGLMGNDHAQITYDNVRVPAENLLGEEEGSGFEQVVKWLNTGQGRVYAAAIALGQAQYALDLAKEYAIMRKQGGQPIKEFQGLRWKFADMKKNIELAKSQIYRAARAVTAQKAGQEIQENIIEQAAISKLHATEMAEDVAREAVQIHGGNGFAKDYQIEHTYRDVKAGTLWVGTSEILRNTIGKTVFGEL